MSNRRAPLSNNTNAVNSPFRTVTLSAIVSKQKRSYANVQREEAYGQPPPAKKQMLESHQLHRAPCKQVVPSTSLDPHASRENGTQEVSIDRKLLAARDSNPHNLVKLDRNTTEELKSIRQWQKHYQRIFPTFVFYFENVPADVQMRYTSAVMSLGARDEKFFSNTVTHVVTTRTIPPPVDPNTTEKNDTSSSAESNAQNNRPLTINPSMLDRSSESISCQLESGPLTKNMTETLFEKKSYTGNPSEHRRLQRRNADVLYKARELGMKIWSLEKLDRIINVIFDLDRRYQVGHRTSTRLHTPSVSTSRYGKETNLQQLLRNEKINGPSDRDLSVYSKDLCLFRGPFICIHDIEQKQKPIMIREYPKVHNKEDGDWPQFRSVADGKCPFIDEVEYCKREVEREKEDLRLRRQREKEQIYNARSLVISTAMQPPKLVTGTRTNGEIRITNGLSTSSTNQGNILAHPKKHSATGTENVSSRGNAFVSRAGAGRFCGGEPIASGVQPVITSAIRSTMSSTAAQPGIKAGTSKEMHGLQRKVLEKKTKDIGPLPKKYPQEILNIAATNIEERANQIHRKRIQEKPSLIRVNLDLPDVEKRTQTLKTPSNIMSPQTLGAGHQEPKPGYCENCLDKFEDFEEHIISRKHRKFAEKLENWKMLDELLLKLARPLRKSYHNS
ncbi:hypothetical protein K3495_g5649 [Podosphaera aphanis]|nr:hypothetical protein K3495_g5649 [Podosphaera aphanis]